MTEHFEFINEVAGTPRNTAEDSGPQLGATYAADFFMKIESDGTQIRGYQSLNGTDWTLVGRPANLPDGHRPRGRVLAGERGRDHGHVGVRLGHADDARWRRWRGR